MDKKPTHRSASCGNLRRPHWTKTSNGLVLLASAGCRLFGERKHRETVYVLCGAKGTAPGCALHGSPKVPSGGLLWKSPTVALTRAFEHTYIVSPLDMAGMIGMAQTLGVNHYGHFTLKNRYIQYHGPAAHPTDKIAIMEWGLVAPFISQDKLPLAIAMIVTINGTQA